MKFLLLMSLILLGIFSLTIFFNHSIYTQDSSSNNKTTKIINNDQNKINTSDSNYNYDPSLLLNGTGFVDFSHNSTLSPENFTIAAWIKTATTTTDQASSNLLAEPAHLVNKGGFNTDEKGQNMNYGIWFSVDGTISGGFETESGEDFEVKTNSTYNDGKWHYILLSYDGSLLRLDIDGEKQISTTPKNTNGAIPDTTGDQPLRIGANSLDESKFFTGNIDEVRVWDRGLTDKEISEIYMNNTFDSKGQIVYLDFGGHGLGTTINNYKSSDIPNNVPTRVVEEEKEKDNYLSSQSPRREIASIKEGIEQATSASNDIKNITNTDKINSSLLSSTSSNNTLNSPSSSSPLSSSNATTSVISGNSSKPFSNETTQNTTITTIKKKEKEEPKEEEEETNTNYKAFNIAVAADWGCDYDAKKTSQNIQKKNPELVIAPGDLSYKGSADCWENIISPFKSKLKISMGDHEYDDTQDGRIGVINDYLNPLNLAKTYYSFDLNNVHFVFIDPYIDYRPGSDQYQFIEQDLKTASTNPKIDWTFVVEHIPMYTSPTKHPADYTIRDIYHPLFDKYGVDLVFSGDNHNYQRTFPLKYNNNNGGSYSSNNPIISNSDKNNYNVDNGVIYLITGTAGRSHYEIKQQAPFIAKQDDKHFGFLNIDIDDETLKGTFYKNEGEQGFSYVSFQQNNIIIDHFTIS